MALEQPDLGEALWRGPEGASRRLVLLHGWGADAHDLIELGPLLAGPQVQVVALQAPLPHPAGSGRQWYALQPPAWSALPEALAALQRRLLALGETLPLTQTVLLGFSQGAAMALDVACGGGNAEGAALPLAGVIGCSGYPHPEWELSGRQLRSLDLRILLTHGEQDPVVPHGASVKLEGLLKQAGAEVELLSFSGGHTIDPGLFGPLRSFVERCWA